MPFKVGDTVTINIGSKRGVHFKAGYIPSVALPDGHITKITKMYKTGWCRVEDCPQRFVYHVDTLLPVNTKKQKLLNAIKDFR